jgi:RNA methyltransferase, TrmH family
VFDTHEVWAICSLCLSFAKNPTSAFFQMISANQQKYITGLHLKKYRQKYQTFLVEGEKMVKELLQQQRIAVLALYGTERWATDNAALLAPHLDKFNPATEAELKKVGTLTTPNAVLALAQLPSNTAHLPTELPDHRPVLYLDRLQDPGNMGTILRIADWFGIAHVCCAPGTADVFAPKTVQAGMGACLRVHTWPDVALSDLHAAFPDRPIVGAVMNGSNLYEQALPKACILAIGNEGQGLDAAHERLLTHRVTIPRGGEQGAESLNAGVAAGILVGKVVFG